MFSTYWSVSGPLAARLDVYGVVQGAPDRVKNKRVKSIPEAQNVALLECELARGLVLHRGGNLAAAEAVYREVLTRDRAQPDALHLLGLIAHQTGHYEAALELYDEAIRLRPRVAAFWSHRGNTLRALEKWDTARTSLDESIRLDPKNAEAHFLYGLLHHEGNEFAQALQSYDRAIALDPRMVAAYNNRGNLLRVQQRYTPALDSLDAAIRLAPADAEAHTNRGNVLLAMGRFDKAVASYDRALAIEPKLIAALVNRGLAQVERKQFAAALTSLGDALRLSPPGMCPKYLEGMQLYLQRMLCDWTEAQPDAQPDDADPDLARLLDQLAQGKPVVTPLCLLALSDSPALQRRTAEIYVADTCPKRKTIPFPPRAPRQRIRVGYFSADFREHPVSSLTAGIFEQHDRSAFEIFGFAYGADTEDAMRRRIRRAMDQFHDVRSLTDAEVVGLSRELEIDIAVDLTGFTQCSRTGIFARRAAPTQANYIGYPGTMGASYMDYLIADEIVVPRESHRHYAEKIVSMPECYQANERPDWSGIRVPSRAECGLQDDAFVYCCFNNHAKISPEVFAGWMRILSKVADSVLWLVAGEDGVEARLRQRASKAGVDPARLIFATPWPYAEHLGRQRLADLFLDTSPFNAGATAGAALAAGLPVLTCIGESFAGRMAASLLHAARLSELVTATREEYERRAIALARDREEFAQLRERLRGNLCTAPLFDQTAFTRALEAAYRAMQRRSLAGLEPENIAVKAAFRE